MIIDNTLLGITKTSTHYMVTISKLKGKNVLSFI